MHLWEAQHPYYASDTEFHTRPAEHARFDSWAEFVENFGDADFDYNLVFRWDWKRFDPENYTIEDLPPPELRRDELWVYFVMQRKGFYWPVRAYVTEADEPAVRAWLAERGAYLSRVWEPLAVSPTKTRSRILRSKRGAARPAASPPPRRGSSWRRRRAKRCMSIALSITTSTKTSTSTTATASTRSLRSASAPELPSAPLSSPPPPDLAASLIAAEGERDALRAFVEAWDDYAKASVAVREDATTAEHVEAFFAEIEAVQKAEARVVEARAKLREAVK